MQQCRQPTIDIALRLPFSGSLKIHSAFQPDHFSVRLTLSTKARQLQTLQPVFLPHCRVGSCSLTGLGRTQRDLATNDFWSIVLIDRQDPGYFRQTTFARLTLHLCLWGGSLFEPFLHRIDNTFSWRFTSILPAHTDKGNWTTPVSGDSIDVLPDHWLTGLPVFPLYCRVGSCFLTGLGWTQCNFFPYSFCHNIDRTYLQHLTSLDHGRFPQFLCLWGASLFQPTLHELGFLFRHLHFGWQTVLGVQWIFNIIWAGEVVSYWIAIGTTTPCGFGPRQLPGLVVVQIRQPQTFQLILQSTDSGVDSQTDCSTGGARQITPEHTAAQYITTPRPVWTVCPWEQCAHSDTAIHPDALPSANSEIALTVLPTAIEQATATESNLVPILQLLIFSLLICAVQLQYFLHGDLDSTPDSLCLQVCDSLLLAQRLALEWIWHFHLFHNWHIYWSKDF